MRKGDGTNFFLGINRCFAHGCCVPSGFRNLIRVLALRIVILATIPSHMLDGANTSALVLAQAAASFSRWEFANIAAAVALLSIALAAIALFFFRRRTHDLTLIYFGLFCILYAVRLLTVLSSFRSLFHEPLVFWSYVNWVITCTIILPFGLFLYQLAAEHLRKFLRWLLVAQTLFAVFGILAAALGVSLTNARRCQQLHDLWHVRGLRVVLGRQ